MSTTEQQRALARAIELAPNDDERIRLWAFLRGALTRGHIESLGQLVRKGPVWDGDVISKEARRDLIELGLASRTMKAGQWGYTVATYRGGHVLNGGLPTRDEERAIAIDSTLLSTHYDQLDVEQLQRRFEIEEEEAVRAMERVERTRTELQQRGTR